MKLIILATAAATLLAVSPAAAASQISDVDYLRANRCRGLASGIPGAVDAAAIDSLVKSESRGRSVYVQQRADQEFDRARREARSDDRKPRLTQELTGACQAFARPMGPSASGQPASFGAHLLRPM
jgi:DNA-binding transcriptional regulator YdaS (Cro superfamily)